MKLTELRKQGTAERQPEDSSRSAATEEAEEMPAGMWVHEIEEILGERCCKPHQLSPKKRKGDPGSAYYQELLVRGKFLREEEDEEDEEDEDPEPNTFWVAQDTLLETIAKEDVTSALKERHERVVDDL